MGLLVLVLACCALPLLVLGGSALAAFFVLRDLGVELAATTFTVAAGTVIGYAILRWRRRV